MKRALLVSLVVASFMHAMVGAQQGGTNISVLPALANPPNAPDGYLRSDQLAQKQVEGSLAFSTRNPLHGMAAFNDYRAVSIAEQGLGEQARAWSNPIQWLARLIFRGGSQRASVRAAGPEAWVGTSFTYDGVTWSGGFVPGGPFDNSPASIASPVKAKNYQAATDPWVVPAPCGRFHVIYVPFTRFQGSAVAVATYADSNNFDGQHTIQYLGTTLVDTGNNAANGPFHDLPHGVVDPTRSATGDPCAYNLYVTWTTFSGNDTSRINLARSSNGGTSFTKGFVSSPAKTNQRAVIAVDPRPGTPKTTGGGTLYVGFRSFDAANSAMWVSRSLDFGNSFDRAVKVNATPMYAFDQQTQPTSQYSVQETTFRTNAYLTLQAVPNNAGMTLFAGWSERVNMAACPGQLCGGPAANGEPRIVMMKSTDAKAQVWTDMAGAVGQRKAIDIGDRDTAAAPGVGYLRQPRPSGAQIQPHFTFVEGRFGLFYLESRAPLVGATGVIAGLDPNSPDGDWRGPQLDARFTIIDPATGGVLGSNQISRYPVKPSAALNNVDTLAAIAEVVTGSPSKQVNYKSTFPNSGGGGSPFIGDYTAVTPVVQYVIDKVTKRWRWATEPGDQPFPGVHTMWADSRHLLPPSGTPIDQASKSPNFNAATSPACTADLGGTRNHDIMTALVNTSVLVSAPTTFKVGPIQRAFPVTVTNASAISKFFRLTFSDNTIASFDQATNIDQLDVELLPFSSTTPVAYLDATATTPETVNVAQLDVSGCPNPKSLSTCSNPPLDTSPTAQTGSVTLNVDPTNPEFQNGANANTEKHNPLVTAPLVTAPLVTAPLVTAPMVTAPLVTASGQANPLVTAPLVTAPLVTASTPSDWNGGVTQYTWTVTGESDTVNSGLYTQIFLDNGGALNSAYGLEMRIYRRTSNTMVVPDPSNAGKCLSVSVPQEELISSIPSPLVTAPLVTAPFVGDNAKNPLVTAATFVAAPPDNGSSTQNASISSFAAPVPGGPLGDLRDLRDNRTYVSLLAYWRGGTSTPPSISTPAIAIVPISINIVDGVPDAAPVVTFFAPDLIVSGTPVIAPAAVTLNGQTQLTWTLKNDGNANADAVDGAFTTEYYLSPDATLDPTDALLGSDTRATPFAAGAVQNFTRLLTVPVAAPAGTYHLFIKIDSGSEISEAKEGNNIVDAGLLKVVAPGILFAANDDDEFNSQPSRMARIDVFGATVTATTLTTTNFPMNGLADGGGFLLAGDPHTNALRKIDYSGNLISTGTSGSPNGSFNEDFAFNGTTLYRAHYDGTSGHQINELNPSTGALVATYPDPCSAASVASGPVGMTFVGNQLWISCWDSSQVGTWSPSTNVFTPKFTVPSLAGGLAYDAANGILWVGRSLGFIEPYDLNGTLLGPSVQPFGPLDDTIDGLEFVSAPALFSVNSGDDGLSVIDQATAAVTFIGPLSSDPAKYTTPIAMAARSSDHKLFVWNNSGTGGNGVLVTVDRCSGAATPVNPSYVPADIGLAALAFSPAGALYGVDSELVSIDPATNAVTTVGPLGSSLRAGGADFSPAGVLYGVDLTLNPTQRLFTVDTATGTATVVATLSQDVGRIGSIVFSPFGTLIGSGFGGPSGDILFDIDPATGAVSNVRTFSAGTSSQGLGFAPKCGGA